MFIKKNDKRYKAQRSCKKRYGKNLSKVLSFKKNNSRSLKPTFCPIATEAQHV
jgi:hypothetical protein